MRWGAAVLAGLGLEARFAEGDESATVFVPELQPRGAKSVREREFGNCPEELGVLVGVLEVVVRDADAQMVNVVEADIAGEELKDGWQFEVRAALQSGVLVPPIGVLLPVGVLE